MHVKLNERRFSLFQFCLRAQSVRSAVCGMLGIPAMETLLQSSDTELDQAASLRESQKTNVNTELFQSA